MRETDKDIERLIVRQLDGELGEEEQLELNRKLVRDPQAQQLMEDYRRVDGLAADALGQTLGKGEVGFDPAALTAETRRRTHRFHQGWWLVPGAIAAAILALVIPQPAVNPVTGPSAPIVSRTLPDVPQTMSPDPHSMGQPVPMHRVGIPRVRRNTGRDVIGVVGDDGNIYWIEIDRTRTLKRPPRPSGRQRTGGDI